MARHSSSFHPSQHKETARTKREGREGKGRTRPSLPLSVPLQSSNLSWGIGRNEIQILNWTTLNSITIERVWKNTESTWDVQVRRRQTCMNSVKANDMGKINPFHVCNPIKFRWLKNMVIDLYTVCTQLLHDSQEPALLFHQTALSSTQSCGTRDSNLYLCKWIYYCMSWIVGVPWE